MPSDRPAADTKTARAAQRAERLARLRATALCTVIDSPTPRGLPADEPAIIAGALPCVPEIVADMALPLAEAPRAEASPTPREIAVDREAQAPKEPIPASNPSSARLLSPSERAEDLVSKADLWSERPPAATASAPPAASLLPPTTTAHPPMATSAIALQQPGSLPPSGGHTFRLDPPEAATPRAPLAMPTFSLVQNPPPEQPAKTEPSPYPIGELYRQLRQNVLAHVSTCPAAMAWICPTGSEPLADHLVELASALAEACDGEVLLVDANFHSAALTKRFNLSEKHGLAEILTKKLAAHAAGHETAVARVRVLPKGGDAVGRASRRASEEEWKSLLAGLKERYRYVLIDAPGVEEPHCLPLAKAADATLVAVALDHTPRETVQEALEHLYLHKARVAGCVVTDAPK
jgi:Mrp family chromosome partitioning ATPase